MKWSWKIARIAGIDIYVHATFSLLLLWVGWQYWQLEGTIAGVIVGISFILLLFSCVVMHEFGHALTARRFGIATRDITLLPIGGVASLERMPDDPKQEILVALAGPAVNLVIALVLWLWLTISHTMLPADTALTGGSSFVQRIMVINLVLALFNLLPAFPMDGGRVVRAALSMRMSAHQATRIAANIGQFLAFMLGVFGLLYNPFLMFIALFIWMGANSESGMSRVKQSLASTTAGYAMLTDFQTLERDDPLSRAVTLTLAGSQKAFPVKHDNEIVGVLSQHDLLKGLQAQGEQAPVSAWMQNNIGRAEAGEPLQKVLERLQACQCPLISVHHAGKIVGIIDLENISELIQIQTAIEAQHNNASGGDGQWRA